MMRTGTDFLCVVCASRIFDTASFGVVTLAVPTEKSIREDIGEGERIV